MPRVFISHTTRDERDHTLACKLGAGLRSRGSDVWIAPDSIPIGSEWEPNIVSAIVSECSHFLVIISTASTESTAVLKEIQLAKERRETDRSFTILPLVVGSVSSYSSKRFIDQFQKVPYHDVFSNQLDAVVASLDLRQNVPHQLAELTRDFVGRDNVFAEIDDFMEKNESGYFTIVGDPGEGKSAILAEYTKRNDCVAHFNSRAEGINQTEQCIKSVDAQFSARFGLRLGLPRSNPAEMGQYWDNLLKEASSELVDHHRLVIAIDALDEVDLVAHPIGANILSLPRYLPKGVYFVLSRRRTSIPFVIQSPQQTFDLKDHRKQSLVDIMTFIQRSIARSELAAWIDNQNLEPETFIDTLAKKSEYNFMYLRYVLPEIEKGAYQSFDIRELPRGLDGYYEDHWDRMGMRANPLPREKIRIVYTMAEARCPVSRSLISDFVNQDPIMVQQVIDEWRQFLHEHIVEGESRYSIYHTSFLDFLQDKRIVEAAGETIEGIHATIADELWQRLTGNE